MEVSRDGGRCHPTTAGEARAVTAARTRAGAVEAPWAVVYGGRERLWGRARVLCGRAPAHCAATFRPCAGRGEPEIFEWG